MNSPVLCGACEEAAFRNRYRTQNKTSMSLRFWQIFIFCLGWMGYASTYFLRKPLGVIKAELGTSLGFTTSQLGWLDTALLFPYAVMAIIFGNLGGTFGLRKVFGGGMMLAALSMVGFGQFSNFYVLLFLLFLNGSAQSQCWPNCTKGLLTWFPESVKNSMFGMFGTCCFGGGIIGTMIAVYLQAHYGWRGTYSMPAIFVFCLGLVVFFFYKPAEEVGIEVPGKENSSPKEAPDSGISQDKPRMWDLWKVPTVAEVAVAVFCLKVVRYCMYMWLPMYLLKALNYTQKEAGIFSTMFEIGGVLGSALIGFVLDRYYKGATIRGISLFCLISAVALVFFIFTSHMGIVVNCVWLFLAGTFNSGPDILLCGTVPAELVENQSKGVQIATIALVNGFGSIGACIEGPIVGLITEQFGWAGMFYFIVGLAAFGAVASYRAAFIHAKVNKTTVDYIDGV